MKKVIFTIVLASMSWGIFAQTTPYGSSKTDVAFNMGKSRIHHRHIVSLEKENKMLVELSTIKSYDLLEKLDAILRDFAKDIAFYKDSLETLNTESIRIDYTTSASSTYSKIRFKTYQPDGNAFLNKKGETSKLKLEQDTIRIIVSKGTTNKTLYDYGTDSIAQVT